jgi:hypothetical protein
MDHINWQQEHERLIKEMARLVGAKSTRNSDINEALAKVRNPSTRMLYDRLNTLNDEVVAKAMKRA